MQWPERVEARGCDSTYDRVGWGRWEDSTRARPLLDPWKVDGTGRGAFQIVARGSSTRRAPSFGRETERETRARRKKPRETRDEREREDVVFCRLSPVSLSRLSGVGEVPFVVVSRYK